MFFAVADILRGSNVAGLRADFATLDFKLINASSEIRCNLYIHMPSFILVRSEILYTRNFKLIIPSLKLPLNGPVVISSLSLLIPLVFT